MNEIGNRWKGWKGKMLLKMALVSFMVAVLVIIWCKTLEKLDE